jgi:Aminoglycoside-2''-adenylyltransferase
MSGKHGWEPLGLEQAAALMRGFSAPWWIVGGWAVDLFVGRETRAHSDVDVVVRRADQELLRERFAGWDIQVALDGELKPWLGRLEPPCNNLWARAQAGTPWQLQFILAQHDRGDWLYRHDESIRLPLADVILHDDRGIPYARPEIVLLSKSQLVRTLDEQDFDAALPLLDSVSRARLNAWLPADHPWRRSLGPVRETIG